MALENGGDDFITKPFHPEIVIAKIRSQLRRAYGEYAVQVEERVLELEGLQLYPERLKLTVKDKAVPLSKREADLIESLIERYPRVAGREDLLEKLWDDQMYVDENTLNVNITRVRKKFEAVGMKGAVETVRGVGYRLIFPESRVKDNETIFKRTCSINFRTNHSIFCHIGDLFFRWLPSFVTGTVCSVPRAFFSCRIFNLSIL